MDSTTEFVAVKRSQQGINFDLQGYDVQVVGSRMTEDGWELIVEGTGSEVDALVLYWQDNGVLLECDPAAFAAASI